MQTKRDAGERDAGERDREQLETSPDKASNRKCHGIIQMAMSRLPAAMLSLPPRSLDPPSDVCVPGITAPSLFVLFRSSVVSRLPAGLFLHLPTGLPGYRLP